MYLTCVGLGTNNALPPPHIEVATLEVFVSPHEALVEVVPSIADRAVARLPCQMY